MWVHSSAPPTSTCIILSVGFKLLGLSCKYWAVLVPCLLQCLSEAECHHLPISPPVFQQGTLGLLGDHGLRSQQLPEIIGPGTACAGRRPQVGQWFVWGWVPPQGLAPPAVRACQELVVACGWAVSSACSAMQPSAIQGSMPRLHRAWHVISVPVQCIPDRAVGSTGQQLSTHLFADYPFGYSPVPILYDTCSQGAALYQPPSRNRV